MTMRRFPSTLLFTISPIGIFLYLAILMGNAVAFDKSSQIGPNPVLPEPNAYLVPYAHVAKAVSWKEGETP